MGKKLVSEEAVEGFVVGDKFYMDGTVILTPGAKDVLRNKGVTIVYGEKPETVEVGCGEAIAETIARMLVKDFGITDEAKIKVICTKVIAAINE